MTPSAALDWSQAKRSKLSHSRIHSDVQKNQDV